MTSWLRTVVEVALAVLAVVAFLLVYLLATWPFWPYLLGAEPWPYQ